MYDLFERWGRRDRECVCRPVTSFSIDLCEFVDSRSNTDKRGRILRRGKNETRSSEWSSLWVCEKARENSHWRAKCVCGVFNGI